MPATIDPRVPGSISNDPLVATPLGASLIPIVDVTNKSTTVDSVRRSIAETFNQASHGFAAGTAIFNNNGTWTKSKADNIATARVDAVVSANNLSAGSFVAVFGGALATSSWIANAQYYLSDTTAGLLTTVAPTALTSFLVSVARANTGTLATVQIGEPLSLAKIPNSALESSADAGGVSPGIVLLYPTASLPTLPAGFIKCDGNNGTTNEAPVGAMSPVIRHGGTVATPAFSVPGGTYGSAQSVTITCPTAGVVIKYTTNGSTPSRSVGTVYSGPVSISATATLKAIAYRQPDNPTLTMIDSAVQSADYTITVGDTSPPTLDVAVIGPAGTVLSLFYSEVVYFSAGGSGGFTLAMSGGPVTVVSASGAGTNNINLTLSRTILAGETGTCSYANPGDGVQDGAGNDAPSVSGVPITNNSTATGGGGGLTLIASDNFDSYTNLDFLHTKPNWGQNRGTINIIKPAADGGFSGSDQSCAHRGDTYTPAQRCEITLKIIGTAFHFVGAAVRCQGIDTRYQFQVDGSVYYLLSRNGGTQTVVPGHSGTALALVAGNKIALEVTGDGLATRLKIEKDIGAGWVTIASNIDPTVYLDGGTPGVVADGGSGTTSVGDDFKGYNVGGGGGGTPGWTYSYPKATLTTDAGSVGNIATIIQKIAATYTGNVDKVSVFNRYVNYAGKTIKAALISGDGTTVLGSGSFVTSATGGDIDLEITLAAPAAVVNGQQYMVVWSYVDDTFGQCAVEWGGGAANSSKIDYSKLYAGLPEVPYSPNTDNRFRVGLHQV